VEAGYVSREPEQLAEQPDGERTGELVDDVDLVLASEVVDQAGDDATEIECHAVDASRYVGGPK
jgi:hypothetical protein